MGAAPASRRTSSACRRVPVLAKTPCSCFLMVSRDNPLLLAKLAVETPPARARARRASAGVEQSVQHLGERCRRGCHRRYHQQEGGLREQIRGSAPCRHQMQHQRRALIVNWHGNGQHRTRGVAAGRLERLPEKRIGRRIAQYQPVSRADRNIGCQFFEGRVERDHPARRPHDRRGQADPPQDFYRHFATLQIQPRRQQSGTRQMGAIGIESRCRLARERPVGVPAAKVEDHEVGTRRRNQRSHGPGQPVRPEEIVVEGIDQQLFFAAQLEVGDEAGFAPRDEPLGPEVAMLPAMAAEGLVGRLIAWRGAVSHRPAWIDGGQSSTPPADQSAQAIKHLRPRGRHQRGLVDTVDNLYVHVHLSASRCTPIDNAYICDVGIYHKKRGWSGHHPNQPQAL